MTNPWQVYDLMMDIVTDDAVIEQLHLGLNWTLCRTQDRLGLAASPVQGVSGPSGSGSLKGRPARKYAAWVREWDPYKSAVGMAVINAAMSHDTELSSRLLPLVSRGSGSQAVFEYFRPQLIDKKVAVVGRYPGMLDALQGIDVSVLVHQPGVGELPEAAAEYVIPGADWVFLSANSLTDKSFPRLAELAKESNLVLMGPATPWLTELSEFGVDFLAGVRVQDAAAVTQNLSEGRGDETGLQYCVADLGACEMNWIKTAIADTVARREWIKAQMQVWFNNKQKGRFPYQAELFALDDQLSSLDTQFKRLWDARH